MEKKPQKPIYILMVLCITMLIGVFLSVLMVMFTRVVLVKELGVRNAFTALLFGRNIQQLNSVEETATAVEIPNVLNWEAQYPFPQIEMTIAEQVQKDERTKRTQLDVYTEKIETLKRRIEAYATTLLLGYQQETELARKYETLIGWNFASYGEYNGVIELSDGYLTSYVEQKNVTEQIEALKDFNDYAREHKINLVYIQAPYKISKYEDKKISGTVDFSNQNVDNLLEGLQLNGVANLDLREVIREEGLSHHELFYRTDHHWLTTTGIWGAQEIMKYCNEQLWSTADISLLDLERFEHVLYPEWFLGSQGKKFTLGKTRPDDFIVLYPKYPTHFYYQVPQAEIAVEGDYSVTYDMRQIEEKDYYGKNPYAGCNYGDQPVIKIENMLATDHKKILIIRDSFADCMISGLALCEKEVDALDLRQFTGSVETYIEEMNPDIIIVMYTASDIGGEIGWDSHRSKFDFR